MISELTKIKDSIVTNIGTIPNPTKEIGPIKPFDLDFTLHIKDQVCKYIINVYIDSKITTPPTLAVDSSYKNFYVQYDDKETTTPKNVTHWQITGSLSKPPFGADESIMVYNINEINNNFKTDPKRGTDTTVQGTGGE